MTADTTRQRARGPLVLLLATIDLVAIVYALKAVLEILQ